MKSIFLRSCSFPLSPFISVHVLILFLIPFFRCFSFSSEVTSWISTPPPFPFRIPLKLCCQHQWNKDVNLIFRQKENRKKCRREKKENFRHTHIRPCCPQKKIWAKNKLPLQKKKNKKKKIIHFSKIFLMHLLLPWELLETLSHRSLSLSLCMW